MFKQLCKQDFAIILFEQPIFTPKTYHHAVTYNHSSADVNLNRISRRRCSAKRVFSNILQYSQENTCV